MLVKGRKTDDRPEEPEVAQMSQGSGRGQAGLGIFQWDLRDIM